MSSVDSVANSELRVKECGFPLHFSFLPSGDKRRDTFPNVARVQHTHVTEPKLELITTRQASKSRDKFWGQGIAASLRKLANQEDGELVSRSPILPELEFFYTKGNKGVAGCYKLLCVSILSSYIGLVPVFL